MGEKEAEHTDISDPQNEPAQTAVLRNIPLKFSLYKCW